MCAFQWFVKITHRKDIYCTQSIVLPSICNDFDKEQFRCRVLNNTQLVLCTFKESLFAWNQVTIFDNSKYAESIRGSGSFRDNKILVSSANSRNFNVLETLQRSFRWRRKNKGLNREPCGIPQVISWFHVEPEKSLNFLGDEYDDLNASCKDTKKLISRLSTRLSRSSERVELLAKQIDEAQKYSQTSLIRTPKGQN